MLFNKKLRITIIHVLLWIGYGFLLLNWLSFGYYFFSALPLVCRTLIIQSAIFYINIGWLLPKFLERNKFIYYVVLVSALVIAACVIYDMSNDLPVIRDAVLAMRPTRPVHHFHFTEGHRPFFGPWLLTNFFSSLAVLFISTTYWVISQSRKRQQWELSMKNENLNTELKFLKSQINPHFLFNALNNIYSLSYTQSGKAPEMIMKLSGMLRYMLYDNNGKKVLLRDEVNYINNYIDFQKLKIEGQPHIDLDIGGVDGSLQIEPMLFIPFIENSFKHSNVEDIQHGWIGIKLETVDTKVIFTINNSVPHGKFTKDNTGGIGLQNIRKRLDLLYPGKHQITISSSSDIFKVSLTIDTQ
jgi:Histidine kinase